VAGGDPGGANTARSAANDEQIGVELSHVSLDQDRMTRSDVLVSCLGQMS
jgi:hypothetical protein